MWVPDGCWVAGTKEGHTSPAVYPSFLTVPLYQEIHWRFGGVVNYNIGRQILQIGCLIRFPIGFFMHTAKFLALFSKLWFPLIPPSEIVPVADMDMQITDCPLRKDSHWLLGVWLVVGLQLRVNSSRWLSRVMVQGPRHFCLTGREVGLLQCPLCSGASWWAGVSQICITWSNSSSFLILLLLFSFHSYYSN